MDPSKENTASYQIEDIVFLDAKESSNAFVETFVYDPQSRSANSMGNLMIVAQIYSLKPKKENARTLAELVSKIKEEYYRNIKRAPIVSFRLAIKKANTELASIYKSNPGVKFHIVAGIYCDGKIASSRTGDCIAAVIRKGEVTELLPKYYSKDGFNSEFSTLAHGNIKQDDIFVLATPQLYRFGYKKVIDLEPNKTLAELLNNYKNELNNLGCIILRIRAQEKLSLLLTKKQDSWPILKNNSSVLLRTIGSLAFIITVAIGTFFAVQKFIDYSQRNSEIKLHTQAIEELQIQAFSLIGLENYEEASLAIKEWQGHIQRLENLEAGASFVKKLYQDLNKAIAKLKQAEIAMANQIISFASGPEQFTAGSIDVHNNFLVVAGGGSYFYKLDLNSKSYETAQLPRDNNQDTDLTIRQVVHDPQSNTFLILTSKSMLEFDNKDVKTLLTRDDFSDVLKFELFRNSIYMLKKDALLQWNAQTNSYSSWLTDKSFERAIDFAIDGFVYVLDDSGTVHKLFQGTRRSTLLQEPGATHIFSLPQTQHIYLFNRSGGVVTIFNKAGTLVKRLANSDIIGGNAITVSEDEKTLFILNEERVFSIDL